jgi:hypothetical protein
LVIIQILYRYSIAVPLWCAAVEKVPDENGIIVGGRNDLELIKLQPVRKKKSDYQVLHPDQKLLFIIVQYRCEIFLYSDTNSVTDSYSVADPGCLSRIPDPDPTIFWYPGSRIRVLQIRKGKN